MFQPLPYHVAHDTGEDPCRPQTTSRMGLNVRGEIWSRRMTATPIAEGADENLAHPTAAALTLHIELEWLSV